MNFLNIKSRWYVLAGIILGVIFGAVLIFAFESFTPSDRSFLLKPVDENIPTPQENVATAPPVVVHRVSFLAVGDIMLSRGVHQAISKKKDPLLPFSQLSSIFSSVDFSFGNFESPIDGTDFAGKSGELTFNTPVSHIEGLVKNKFFVLSLANNHSLDRGEKAVISTKKTLQEKNIHTTGTGANLDEAWTPAYATYNDITIAFIAVSYASYNDNGKRKNEFIARMDDEIRLKNAIEAAKKNADYVIVSMHAGVEYKRNPNQMQQAFARKSIDLGADMIIGAHPHWIQTIEEYKGKMIFYSLGNFIFDQEWSQDTKEGLMLKISLEKIENTTTLKNIEYLPVVIENYSTPRLANEIEKKKILEKIGL